MDTFGAQSFSALLLVREVTEDDTMTEAARMEVVLSLAMQWDEYTLGGTERPQQFWADDVPRRWRARALTPRWWRKWRR